MEELEMLPVTLVLIFCGKIAFENELNTFAYPLIWYPQKINETLGVQARHLVECRALASVVFLIGTSTSASA